VTRQERRNLPMATLIEQNWDKFAELSLREDGVTV
jgi:hypothetical protein